MLEPKTFEEAIARVKADYQEAAQRSLPKLSWLKGLCGRKYYESILHSEEWKEISGQYDKISMITAEEKPRQLLMKALEATEQKLEAGEGLNAIDIAIFNALQNSNRNRQYLELHRKKYKLEAERAAAEEARKDREEARKDRAEERAEQAHEVEMEHKRAEIEAIKGGGVFHILELDAMSEEQYLAYNEGREF